MEQLINVAAQVRKLQARAQTEAMTPDQIEQELEHLKTSIKSVRFPRVPNKEDAMNRMQLIQDIASGYAKLEYMLKLIQGKAPEDVSKFIAGKTKEVQKWI